MKYSIKNIVKDNTVIFNHYRAGFFFFNVTFKANEVTEIQNCYENWTYQFPVPQNDIGQATLHKEDKAIIFMRYIRKAIEDQTWVRIK